MERNSHPKHIPTFIPAQPPVDLYIKGRSEDDTAYPILNTGITRPIYDLNGSLHYTLPLDQYPLENDFHKEVYLMQRYYNQYLKTNPRFRRTHGLQADRSFDASLRERRPEGEEWGCRSQGLYGGCHY
jgi:hypothetical protein